MKGPALKRTSWFGWIRLWIQCSLYFALFQLCSAAIVVLVFHRVPKGPAPAWIPGFAMIMGMASMVTKHRKKREEIAFRNACDLLHARNEGLSIRAGEEGRVVAEFPLGTLAGSNLAGHQLAGASLWGADLRSADLSHADLNEAWLRDAIAGGASFRGANLRRAALERADLRGADLRGADLREAELSGARLEGALYDRSTRWPRGFRLSRRGCVYDPDAEQVLPIPSETSGVDLQALPLAAGKPNAEAETLKVQR